MLKWHFPNLFWSIVDLGKIYYTNNFKLIYSFLAEMCPQAALLMKLSEGGIEPLRIALLSRRIDMGGAFTH